MIKFLIAVSFLLFSYSCKPANQPTTFFPSSENNSLLLFYNELEPARYAGQFRQVQRELSALQANSLSRFHILVPTAFKIEPEGKASSYSMLILIDSAPLNDLEIVRSQIESRSFRSIWSRSGEILLMPMQAQISVIESDFKLISLETRSISFFRLSSSEKQAVLAQENQELRKYNYMPDFQSFSTPGNLFVRVFSSFQLSGLLEVTNSNAYYGSLRKLETTKLMIFRRLNPEELNPDYL